MMEEIAYAELNFQRSFKEQENIPKGHTVKHKDIPVSVTRWRFCALVSLILCLLLTIGLLVLGFIYFQGSAHFQKEYGDLKSMMQDLRTNSSMRILDLKKHLCLKGEEENMQTEPRCILCPSTWHLIGVTCYYISGGLKSWQESKQFCDSRNSTLLMINEENKELAEETLRKRLRENSWIGIHKDKSGQWIWANGTHIAQLPTWLQVSYTKNKEECAYLYTYGGMYVGTCDQKYQWICEKASIELA